MPAPEKPSERLRVLVRACPPVGSVRETLRELPSETRREIPIIPLRFKENRDLSLRNATSNRIFIPREKKVSVRPRCALTGFILPTALALVGRIGSRFANASSASLKGELMPKTTSVNCMLHDELSFLLNYVCLSIGGHRQQRPGSTGSATVRVRRDTGGCVS